MSKHETPLTRAYWETVGGTLYEEFLAVEEIHDVRQNRRLDGVIVLNGNGRPRIASRGEHVSLNDRDVIVVQTKVGRLNWFHMGQGLLSPELIRRRWQPASLRSVLLCTADDPMLSPLLKSYPEIELRIVPPTNGKGMSQARIPHAVEWIWQQEGGGLLAPATLAPGLKVEGLIVLGQPRARLVGEAAALVKGKDVCLVHSAGERRQGRTRSLGMYVSGEAIFAAKLVRQMGARSVRSVILCQRSDDVIEKALHKHDPGVTITVHRP
jgi:hypothetical protein